MFNEILQDRVLLSFEKILNFQTELGHYHYTIQLFPYLPNAVQFIESLQEVYRLPRGKHAIPHDMKQMVENKGHVKRGPGPIVTWLTHWGQDKMATISQMIFSNSFSQMKMYEFQ